MKHLFPSAALVLCLVGCSAVPTAEKQSALPPSAGKASVPPSLAGAYSGKWKSSGNANGTLRLRLKQDGAAAWTAEAAFTFEGTEIAPQVKSIKVDGTKVELVFAWEIQGTAGQSRLSGELTGETLEGKYDSNVAENASIGTWSVTRG